MNNKKFGGAHKEKTHGFQEESNAASAMRGSCIILGIGKLGRQERIIYNRRFRI